MFYSRVGAASFSFVVVSALIVLKVVVGVLTGSISIMAQAADSFLDLFAVGITFFAVNVATKPPDVEHPFGHGKVENIAGVAQAVLIFTAAGLIVYSAINRILTGAIVEMTEVGMGVMLVSIITSIFLSRHLLRVSQETDSLALQGVAHNIAADVYSASAVLVGLLIVRFTGIYILDPILALLVSVFVIRVGYKVVGKSFGGLIDVRLSEEEENAVKSAIKEYSGEFVDFHALRTRKAGRQRYIDLHLVVSKYTIVEEAHKLCDEVERQIKGRLPHTSVVIHVEPCSEECVKCPVSPEKRKKEKSGK